MVKRLFISLIFGFVIGTMGLILFPYAGRLAEPFLCKGTLQPETRQSGLRFRCIEAADGRVIPVPADRVVLYTVPMLALMLLFPVHAALAEAERRARSAKGTMKADLAVAVRARAEILRISRRVSFNRQTLMRAAELQLILWVQPPAGRPYEAKVAWLVEDESLTRLTDGSIVSVRVNPRRPQHIYPDQPWAHYAWWH